MQYKPSPHHQKSDRDQINIDNFMAASRATTVIITDVLNQYRRQFRYNPVETAQGGCEIYLGHHRSGSPNGPHISVLGDKVKFAVYSGLHDYYAGHGEYRCDPMGHVYRTEGDEPLKKHLVSFLANVGFGSHKSIKNETPHMPAEPKGPTISRTTLRLNRAPN